jgi:uncharacterized integral membrane protein
MLSLIVAILFGVSLTFFAFQNSVGVPVALGSYQVFAIPLYLVVVFSVLLGILMASFISGIEGISSYLTLRRKNHIITTDERTINELQQKIHNLEMENAKLRSEHKEERRILADERVATEDMAQRPSFFDRIFPSSRRWYSKV